MLRLCCCWLSAVVVAVSAHAKTPGLAYLSQMTDPLSQGAGNVAAAPIGGTASLGANPSGLADGDRGAWRFMSLTVPETRVQLLTNDVGTGLEPGSELVREGYSLRVARQSIALSDSTRLALELGFRDAGGFTRVNHEGKSIHAFQSTDWTVGLNVSQRLGDQLSVGGAAKWLRSKSGAPGDHDYGHGWAFDIGTQFEPTAAWTVGLTARNLSNGVSLPDDTPRHPRHEIVVGAARRIDLSPDFELSLAGDVRFPSRVGTQLSTGATLAVKESVGFSVGYQRHVERWRSLAINLETDEATTDERVWEAEGVTVGAWTRVGGWEIGVAGTPVYLPRATDDARWTVETTEWQWSIAVGRGR